MLWAGGIILKQDAFTKRCLQRQMLSCPSARCRFVAGARAVAANDTCTASAARRKRARPSLNASSVALACTPTPLLPARAGRRPKRCPQRLHLPPQFPPRPPRLDLYPRTVSADRPSQKVCAAPPTQTVSIIPQRAPVCNTWRLPARRASPHARYLHTPAPVL